MRKLLPEEMGRVTPEEYKRQAKMPLVVILDNIRSMNNVGSVFRTCDAFGVERLYLCGITASPPNKEITKTALGATESVDWVHVPDTAALVQELKGEGWQVYAVEQVDDSKDFTQFSFDGSQKYALILGNEVFGVDDAVLPLCDGAIEIPQVGVKHSLNVSVTGGIVIWEFFRQLQQR